MGLLDDIQVSIEIPNKVAVTTQATRLLKQHTTRRGKRKKKKPRDAKWLRKVAEAKQQQALMKRQMKERAQQFADFKRLISGD